jgi:hypothetical protein
MVCQVFKVENETSWTVVLTEREGGNPSMSMKSIDTLGGQIESVDQIFSNITIQIIIKRWRLSINGNKYDSKCHCFKCEYCLRISDNSGKTNKTWLTSRSVNTPFPGTRNMTHEMGNSFQE